MISHMWPPQDSSATPEFRTNKESHVVIIAETFGDEELAFIRITF